MGPTSDNNGNGDCAGADAKTKTAGIIIIGDEVLKGQVVDVNSHFISKELYALGVKLSRISVISDELVDIAAEVRQFSSKFDYVFTTGGVGPTHDDITVDAVGAAFGVPVSEHPEAAAMLLSYYGKDNATPARMRMARAPKGATLLANPVSIAPGIKMENVYVLAGVPDIMQAMLDGVVSTLRHGPALYSMTVSGFIAESLIAEELAAVATKYPELDIGSYPWVRHAKFGTALVARGTNKVAVHKASKEILAAVNAKGVEATLSEG